MYICRAVKPDVTWQVYRSIWSRAIADPSYAERATKLSQHWLAWRANIIREGIQSSVFRELDTAQVARLLGAMLNGYSDDVTVFQNIEERYRAIGDTHAFIDRMLSECRRHKSGLMTAIVG